MDTMFKTIFEEYYTPTLKEPIPFLKRWRFLFPNGYGASVLRGFGTYGSSQGLFELAVLKNGKICYDTHITSDVIGNLSDVEVSKKLLNIFALPMVDPDEEELYDGWRMDEYLELPDVE